MNIRTIQTYVNKEHLDLKYSSLFITKKNLEIKSFYIELTIIEIFIDIYESEKNYSNNFDINLFNRFIEEKYTMLICFLYFHVEGSLLSKYRYSRRINTLIQNITNKDFKLIKVSHNSICKNIKDLETTFKKTKINENKNIIYNGWEVRTLDNYLFNISLYKIHKTYGMEFCQSYHEAIKKIALCKIKSSFTRDITNIYKINDFLLSKFHTVIELKKNLNAYNSYKIFNIFYNILLINTLLKKECLISFHHRWKAIVNTYLELTENGLFEAPHFTIITPKFKTSTNLVNSKTVNGKIINKKLITEIPLHYTDDITKEIIYSNIQSDLDTCLTISNHRMKIIQKNHDYFLNKNIYSKLKQQYISKPFSRDDKDPKSVFLQTKSKSLSLNKKIFGCISLIDLYALVMLLIIEHPQITESWLINWKYIKDDKNYGYTVIDDNAYIISHKPRKRNSALQKILLTDKSHTVVKLIIKITALARDYLKSIGDPNYEFMLLFSISPFTYPKPVNKFLNPSTPNTFTNFNELFFCTEAIPQLTKKQTKRLNELVRNFSLTRLRATAGVIVYFETNSIDKMRIALGHSRLDVKLLNSYLPKPLWDYFTDRWIRIFQNIIIYESLKDTNFLFDAMDISESNLESFLNNHHFGEIPQHIQQEKISNDQENSINKIGIFTISIPLLQVFNAIVSFIETSTENTVVPDFIYKWYQCAILVISQIRLSIESKNDNPASLYLDEQVLEMYRVASKNPLDITKIGWV